MAKRIIYPTDAGGIVVLIPAPCNLLLEEIAQKDVPKGTPYKIIDSSELPEDRETRPAWEANFSHPDGFGLGYELWAEKQKEKESK